MKLIFRIPEFVVRWLPLSVLIALMAYMYGIGIGKNTYAGYGAVSFSAIIVLLIVIRGFEVLATRLSELHWGE